MTPHEDALQGEIERELAVLAGELSLSAPPSVLERARAAARAELSARCAGMPAAAGPAPGGAAPSPAVRRQTLEDVEPLRSALMSSTVRSGRRSRVFGGLAAAALIALSFGIIRFSERLRPDEAAPSPLAMSLDTFLETAEGVFAEDPLTALISLELDSLEYGISQWDLEDDGDPAVHEPDGRTSIPGRGLCPEADTWLPEPGTLDVHVRSGRVLEGVIG